MYVELANKYEHPIAFYIFKTCKTKSFKKQKKKLLKHNSNYFIHFTKLLKQFLNSKILKEIEKLFFAPWSFYSFPSKLIKKKTKNNMK